MKQIMITVYYARLPKTTSYRSRIDVDQVEVAGEHMNQILMEQQENSCQEMSEMITQLHGLLQKYPDAKVTMLQEMTRPGIHLQVNKKAYELDEKMTAILRNDLEEAKKLFAPIEQVVIVRPAGARFVPQPPKGE